jgi:hypothetical protein
MANIDTTNIDVGAVQCDVKENNFRDELITFAGADTFVAGTILARDSGSLKLVKYVKGGSTNGNGIPKAVVTYDVVAAGASDVPARVLLAGTVYKHRLVIDADGDDSNVDAAVIDELRAVGIVPLESTQLDGYDNPQTGNPDS